MLTQGKNVKRTEARVSTLAIDDLCFFPIHAHVLAGRRLGVPQPSVEDTLTRREKTITPERGWSHADNAAHFLWTLELIGREWGGKQRHTHCGRRKGGVLQLRLKCATQAFPST